MRPKKISVAFILLFFSHLASGYTEFLVKPGNFYKPASSKITRTTALGELNLIQKLLERGYAGYEVHRERGLDWNKLFREAKAAFGKEKWPKDAEEYRKLLLSTFSAIPDNHLGFSRYDEKGRQMGSHVGFNLYAYASDLELQKKDKDYVVIDDADRALSGARLTGCQEEKINKLLRLSLNSKLKPVYHLIHLSREKPDHLSCSFVKDGSTISQKLPLHRVRSFLPKRETGPAFEFLNPEKTQLRIRSFGFSDLMNTFLESAGFLIQEKALLIDLRGNTGGQIQNGLPWLLAFTTKDLYFDSGHTLTSEVTLQGDINRFAGALASPSLDQTGRKKYQESLSLRKKKYAEYQKKYRGRPFTEWHLSPLEKSGKPGTAKAEFSGHLVILTDAGCKSACESFIMLARQLPGTLVIGENTGGTREFALSRPYRLPESGVFINIPISRIHHPDPAVRFVEGRGYLPDFWVDEEDARALAQKLTRELSANRLTELLTHKKPFPFYKQSSQVDANNQNDHPSAPVFEYVDRLAADATAQKYRTGEIDPAVLALPAALEKNLFAAPSEKTLVALVKSLTDDTPDPFIKAKRIHDWITLKIAYDSDLLIRLRTRKNPEGSLEPYEFLKYQRSNCDGLARLYHLMARAAGLQSKYVTGYLNQAVSPSGELGSHAWNLVFLENKWYIVDTSADIRSFYRNGKNSPLEDYRAKSDHLFIHPEAKVEGYYAHEAENRLLQEDRNVEDFRNRPLTGVSFYKYGLSFDPASLQNRKTRQGAGSGEGLVIKDVYPLNQNPLRLRIKAPVDVFLQVLLRDEKGRVIPGYAFAARKGEYFECDFYTPEGKLYQGEIQARSLSWPQIVNSVYAFEIHSTSASKKPVFPIQEIFQAPLHGVKIKSITRDAASKTLFIRIIHPKAFNIVSVVREENGSGVSQAVKKSAESDGTRFEYHFDTKAGRQIIISGAPIPDKAGRGNQRLFTLEAAGVP